MKTRSRSFLYYLVSIAVVIAYLATAVSVRADDETPPPATEAPVVDVAPTDEPVATDVPAATDAPVATDVPTATAAPNAAEANTPADILNSAPAGVDVVVLDENGDPLSLTTQEAAQIIMNGDPMWCIDGVTPNTAAAGECTPSYPDFASLVADLADGGYAGSGTIYVAYDYSASEGLISINHGNGSLADLIDLTIQGGWDFANDEPCDGVLCDDESTLNGTWLSISNWTGIVTVKNIFIDNADDIGLSIDTQGNVYINNLSVDDSDKTGAYISTQGDVDVTNSDFTNNGIEGFSYSDPGSESYNADNGLVAVTPGDITLTGVIASGNGGDGAYLDGNDVTVTGSVFIENGYGDGEGANWSSVFDYDASDGSWSYSYSAQGGDGLFVDADGNGAVTLDDVFAGGNARDGASLNAEDGDVFVTNSSFEGNGDLDSISVYNNNTADSGDLEATAHMDFSTGNGLSVNTNGDITLETIYAGGNANYGAQLHSGEGDVQVTDAGFIENGWGGNYFDYGPGYDILDYIVAGSGDGNSFCEAIADNGYSYNPVVFDPCLYSDFIEVQSSTFTMDLNFTGQVSGIETNDYTFDQSAGDGLRAEADNGTITLQDAGIYANGGNGAYLLAGDDISVTDVGLEENGYGVDVYVNESYSSNLTISLVSGEVSSSFGAGLVAESDGDVTLSEVGSFANGGAGASVGGVSVFVEDSEFSYNGSEPVVIGGDGLFGPFLDEIGFLSSEIPLPFNDFDLNFGLYEDPDPDTGQSSFFAGGYGYSSTGLEAYADENITLENVYAAENSGYGADLWADEGSINVSDSGFFSNGYGISGGFNVSSTDSTDDAFDSMYSSFGASNGSGLSAYSNYGNVTLDGVASDGNMMHGAELGTNNGGSVFVTESEFIGNGGGFGIYGYYSENADGIESDGAEYYGDGLYIDTTGKVTLIDVTANNNYYNGAEVYSAGGRVIVSCGQYDENGYGAGDGYGIYEDGASSLELYGPEILGNYNSPDEYFFSGSIILSDDCTIPSDQTGGGRDKKPVPGSAGVCVAPATNATYKTSNGDFATFPCPINDQASVRPLSEDKLPGELGDGQKFLSAMVTNVIRDNQPVDELENAALVSFIIPEGVDTETLAILFWDGTQWTDLGGELSADGLHFEVSTKLLGTFVLVSQ